MSCFVEGRPSHDIRGFCRFLVARFWVGAAAAVVGLSIATGQAVVLGFKRGGWSARSGLKIRELFVEFIDVEQRRNKLVVDEGEFESQYAVCSTEVGDCLAIVCRVRGEVSNGVGRIVLVNGVG
jgi:hypothetical protein